MADGVFRDPEKLVDRMQLALLLRLTAHNEPVSDPRRAELQQWASWCEDGVFCARDVERKHPTLPLRTNAVRRLLVTPTPDGYVMVPKVLLEELVESLERTFREVGGVRADGSSDAT